MDDTYTSPLSPTAGEIDRKEEDTSNVLSQRTVTPDIEVSRTYKVACFVFVAPRSSVAVSFTVTSPVVVKSYFPGLFS